jgi:predicted nucleic acid-binding Zn ribbon protein
MKEMQDDKVEAPICPKCGQRMKREFGVGDIKGSGGGWFGKSIDNLKAQSDERKRQGDGIRRETGLGAYNVKRNIH